MMMVTSRNRRSPVSAGGNHSDRRLSLMRPDGGRVKVEKVQESCEITDILAEFECAAFCFRHVKDILTSCVRKVHWWHDGVKIKCRLRPAASPVRLLRSGHSWLTLYLNKLK